MIDTSIGHLLTVIITTSVTPSAPSTELISSILESFDRHCPALTHCRVIVVFDAYDQVVSAARLKKGYVTAQQAADFASYKQNVKALILERYCQSDDQVSFIHSNDTAEYGSLNDPQNSVSYTTAQTHDKKVAFIEPSRRLGFGLAVRSALRLTKTPYVWVQQHDWALVHQVPIAPMLQVIETHDSDPDAPIKYICLPAIRMLSYATSADVARFPVLRELTASLPRDFNVPSQPDVQVPLTPLYFWHDKPHLASTAHYLQRVFPTRLAMLRGDFIEDKIGQRARAQMKDGLWAKWATWLYYPDDGKRLCLRHLQGRTREGAVRQAEKAAIWRQKNERDAN
ncbi:hypothetical protein FZEAL_2166 [Fusarium zealandicum]|uniref:Uncharacterized protein n=1 Tax=Fusarium zealandicum TaxID=1053134 RepID=A0A8H4URN9_9HYPO|nr:hypothetical protein FZEAL_2166 [Fusarium zealandicum]